MVWNDGEEILPNVVGVEGWVKVLFSFSADEVEDETGRSMQVVVAGFCCAAPSWIMYFLTSS